MKITNEELKQIIKEELSKALKEWKPFEGAPNLRNPFKKHDRLAGRAASISATEAQKTVRVMCGRLEQSDYDMLFTSADRTKLLLAFQKAQKIAARTYSKEGVYAKCWQYVWKLYRK